MSQNLPDTTIAQVTAEINKAFRGVLEKDSARRDAREMFTDASNDAGSARETFLIDLAGMAARNKWSEYAINSGIEKALEQRNDKDTSIRTFASEIKRACHPQARAHVQTFAKLASEVWDRETAQDKKLPRPCRAAFARKYHMLQRMIGEAVDSGRVINTSHDCVQWALSLDPKRNPERMFKRLKALRDELHAIADEFPLDAIVESAEGLREVTLSDFKAALGAPRPEKDSGSSNSEPEQEVTPTPDDSGSNENAPEDMSVADRIDDALADLDI